MASLMQLDTVDLGICQDVKVLLAGARFLGTATTKGSAGPWGALLVRLAELTEQVGWACLQGV